MPFKKGKSGNVKGKPVGTLSKVTKDKREIASLLIDTNITRMQGWIDDVAKDNPERAYKMVLDLFEYSLPKLKAIELTGKDGKELIQRTIIVQSDQAKNDLNKL